MKEAASFWYKGLKSSTRVTYREKS